MIITLISDTHNKHQHLNGDLPGGDLLIHAGDLMNSGYDEGDIWDFLGWLEEQSTYKHQLFIAGNHDRYFENHPDEIKNILTKYPYLTYLQDNLYSLYNFDDDTSIKIYGSPWQPEFHNWAFNLPRNGKKLQEKWNAIPENLDILITHGPPFGHCDVTPYGNMNVGCEVLRARIDVIKPKIHVFGHIHSGYGYKFYDGTHFINAAVLNERYDYKNKPITIDWNPDTNEIEFI